MGERAKSTLPALRPSTGEERDEFSGQLGHMLPLAREAIRYTFDTETGACFLNGFKGPRSLQ